MISYQICFWFILCLPVVLYLKFYWSRRRLYELAEHIPGIQGYPLLGNTLEFYGNSLDITKMLIKLCNTVKKCGGTMKLWLGSRLIVVIVNPRDAEVILTKELKKDPNYRFAKPWLGNGLLTADVATWKIHRKMLMPSFNQKTIDGFIEIFVENSDRMVKKMLKTEGTFNASDYVFPCTLDFICETAMAVQVNAQTNMETPYIQATGRMMALMLKRIFRIWFHSDWIYELTSDLKKLTECKKIVKDFTKKIITIRRKTINGLKNTETDFDMGEFSLSKKKTFIDFMLEQPDGNNQWTDEAIQDEVSTFMVTGNDTSATTTSFALVILGSHPRIQNKVHDELYEIFGDSKRPATKGDLSRMKYLDRVIKETLRLFPIAPIIVREIEREVKIENYTLPSGIGCAIGIYGLHRDPSVWGENPDDFDPDHFLPENCEKRHPYSYIPFSAGPRNCIAKLYAVMSLKIMLSTILRTLKVHSSIDYKTMNLVSEFVLKSTDGYPISVQPRY